MNVTVIVSQLLQAAVEGRTSLNLGLPPRATLSDVVETLFKLYPKLQAHLAGDKKHPLPKVHVFASEEAMADLARGRSGLKDGARIYFCGVSGTRVTNDAVGPRA